MKVALLGLEEDFDLSLEKARYYSVRKYMYHLYEELKKSKEVKVTKVLSRINPFFRANLSMLYQNLFKDFSEFDIVHNPSSTPVFIKKKNILISTIFGFESIFVTRYEDKDKKTFADTLRQKIVVPLVLKSILSSDYLIAVSSVSLKRVTKLGYDKNRVFVVNQGVDDRYLTKAKQKKRGKEFVVGYVGTFRARKNVAFAIRAFKKIKDKDMRFEIYGNKKFLYPQLLEIAGSDKRIEFVGFAPEEKLISIYDSFDAFVFPTFYEGFGIPIFEAQARGLPVITYKHAEIPEEVRRYCLEAEDEDGMAAILSRLKERGYEERSRKRAMEYARSFTWKKHAERTIEVYKKCLQLGPVKTT